jgi:Na+/melibiose symporter-like transporter
VLKYWPNSLRWSAAPPDVTGVQRRNFINVQVDGIGVGLASAAAPFLPVLLTRLGASNFEVGLLTAMPAITGLLLAMAIGRFLQRQRQIVPWYSRARFIYLMSYALTGVALIAAPPQYQVSAVLIIWALATLPSIILNVCFSVVMNAIAGPKGRYELMSRRWSVLGLTSALTVFTAGYLLERLPFPFNYQIVFIALSAGGLISLYFSSHIVLPDTPLPAPTAPRAARGRLSDTLDMLRDEPAFSAFVAKRFIFLSGIALAAPIFPLYFVRVAQANDAQIGLISTIQSVSLLFGYRLWTRLSQARGARLVLLCTSFGMGLYPALVSLTGSIQVILVLAGTVGIFQAGLDLVFFDELMRTVPPERTALFVSFAQSLQHLSAIASPLIGTLLADHIGLGGALVFSAGLRLIAFLLFMRARPVGARAAA